MITHHGYRPMPRLEPEETEGTLVVRCRRASLQTIRTGEEQSHQKAIEGIPAYS